MRFSGAQDAVGRLFALAQALVNDYEQFEALVEEGDAGRGGGAGRGRRAQRRCSRRPRARQLLEEIDTGTLAGLRDRALVSVMLYSFARVSAVIGMRRPDYFRQERQGWLRLHEKGGQRHDVPAHHRSAEALSRRIVLAMIKRRAAAVDLPPSTCCHTFWATGITAYLSNGGTLEHAQQIAGHASPKTTKLYQAVIAFTEALKERTPERVPLEWASTQSNLGRAIQILRERSRAV